MQGFKEFINEATEEEKNIRATLKKIPKNHSKLIAGYKFHWLAGNTLDNDDEHVGIINPQKKTITIAAPWNYPREFTFLHELGHKVWSIYMTPELKKEWRNVVKNTKNKMKQNDEELWCHMYANHYVKNKMVIHNHPSWEKFMNKFLKVTAGRP